MDGYTYTLPRPSSPAAVRAVSNRSPTVSSTSPERPDSGSHGSSPETSSAFLTQEEDGHNKTPTGGKKYPDYCRTLQVRDSNGGVKELVFPKALDLDRPKRARTTFSAEQLYKLEREFQRNQYLVGRERTDLAVTLQLSETQVKVWFQNRRTKYKRDNSRQAEDRKQHAEGLAACNILRMLQQKSPPASGGPTQTSEPAQAPPPVSSHHGAGTAHPHPPPPPMHTPPSIPIAVSITNRPVAVSMHGSVPAISVPALAAQTNFGQMPFAQAQSRFHFPPPPPHMAHMAAAHAHASFASGFYTS